MLVRLSIRSMLEEIGGPWEIAGEASNGADMLEQIKSGQPDVVLVDINMPRLNGLEAIRSAREHAAHTRFIILSGYSEFQYAQEALKLGVDDYLLKPVDPDELQAALQRSEEKWLNQRHAANKHFETEVTSWLYCKASSPLLLRPDLHWQGSILYVDSGYDERKLTEYIKDLRTISAEIIETYHRPDVYSSFISLPGGEPAWISAWGPNNDMLHNRGLKELEKRLQSRRSPLLAVTTFRSAPCASPEVLFAQLEDLHKKAHLRAVIGINKEWEPEALAKYEQDHAANELGAALIQLAQSFKEGAYLNYSKTIEQLAVLLDSNPSALASYSLGIAAFIGSSLHYCLGKDGFPDKWLEQLSEHGERLLLAGNYSTNCKKIDLVQQCISFMESNYASDISVGQVADKLDVTPNYLSSLFHKKTGTTFIRYLTKIRMLKAQEYLADPALQIQEIAEKVGYFSTRHFTKLFTEFSGCYPSDYRKKLRDQ